MNDHDMPRLGGFGWVNTLVLAGIVLFLALFLIPGVRPARQAARRTQWRNNLKQIGLALHNYHDVHNVLPPGGIFREDGTPMHGWTYALAPDLEANPSLSRVDSNIPWNDPRNASLFSNAVTRVLLDPRLSDGPTHHGGFPINHMAANQWLMHRNSSVRLKDITSGTSHTMIMANAAGDYAPVGEPHNWRDPEEPLLNSAGSFGYPGASVTCYLMADGGVQWVDSKIDPRVLAPMAGPPALRPSREQVSKPPGAWYPGRQ